MAEQRYEHCPRCSSVRLKRYHRSDNDFFCPRCREVFIIEARRAETCFHCGRLITDLSRAGLWGNDRYKHLRCRRVKAQGARALREAAV